MINPTDCVTYARAVMLLCSLYYKFVWWQALLEKTFLEAQLREIERLKEEDGEGAEGSHEDAGIRTTQRYALCRVEYFFRL